MTDIVMLKNSTEDQVKDVIRQLLDLYERQLQDRHILIQEKEALGNLTQLLINQTREIGQYEAGIRKRIQDCIKESADNQMKQIADSVVDKTSQIIENSHVKMAQICQSMEAMLTDFRTEKKQSSWKIMAAVIIGSILSSLFSAWLMLPKPILPLTDDQINYLQTGQTLMQMWPKLTKKEKDRLKAVSNEVLQAK